MNKLKDSDKPKIASLVAAGLRQWEIALIYKVRQPTIHRYLVRLQIPRTERRKSFTAEELEGMCAAYRAGRTAEETAEQFCSTKNTIRRHWEMAVREGRLESRRQVYSIPLCDVPQIRKLLADGKKRSEIAELYNCCPCTVTNFTDRHKLKNKQRWKPVTENEKRRMIEMRNAKTPKNEIGRRLDRSGTFVALWLRKLGVD